ncbi:hypothetical protein DRF65_27795 [Chryseobacterium pennae]|uniref:Uncharacterized protein n=1 Tax=Chryseobacterium pennae TaxID=2258962 RepID=A0A3D9C0N2_9FLAO|nr:hypothetical protein [Chryseobacterium pennae]REC59112.1 hypothetical protein DRF65_27795 [Chryseobacterium pennae]
MSRTRIVKGNIYEVVEEHLNYYSEKDIVETASTTYVENSETDILYGGNPEKAPSADLVNYYIKVRIYNPPVVDPANPPKKYNGEFGFDWIDVDPSSEEVQKIQDVDFSNVEYFYKKGATANDLGDIIAKSADEQGAKDAITANYRLGECPKPCKDGKIDMPFVLMKPGQEISLSLEVALTSGVLNNEKIYLEGNDCYSFELVGGTKTGNKTEKIIADKEIVVLKIKCLKESPETTFKIKQENPTQKLETVGGFTMMENKILKLKFRVIALVANEPTASAKAQALFQKFKDNKVKEYLNENSLNQAGYEVEIENQAMFDTLGSGDLDDYFYAFDKTDWTNKKYFGNVIKQKYDVIPGTNTCKPGSVDASGNCKKVPVPTDVIVDNQKDLGGLDKANAIDEIAITEYKNKLKTKSKTYEGGIIILSDFESSDPATGAYSRTSPLNHYALIVYSTNTESKDTYAHEIGHMLGLPHLFFDAKEKDSYKIARENILGNGKPDTIIKDGKNVPNPECILPIAEQINKSLTESKYYIRTEVYAKKSTIKRQLQLSINYFTTEKSNEQRDKARIETAFRGQPDTVIVAGSGTKTQTKGVYIGLCNTKITQYINYLNDNNIAMSEINALTDNDKIKKHSFKMIFKASHYTAILRESNVYYKNVINQIHSNNLMFIQGKTKNIMDYHNERVVFLHNQIKVMRDDLANY